MYPSFRSIVFIALPAVALLLVAPATVSAQIVDVTDGYLDIFELTDGRVIDIGELGGGIIGSPSTHKITVPAQPTMPSPPMPSDGRLTGTVHGKLRVVFLTDRNSDGFINGGDLDSAFDVSWQLVGFDKAVGAGSAAFQSTTAVGPEGTARPFGPGDSVNFPPTAGGTNSVWSVSTCDGTGFNPNTGNNICSPFAITSASPYTGFVDYTFPLSIPTVNDFTPGLTISPLNWIIAATVANRAEASPPGNVTFGPTAIYSPQLAVTESQTDLFGPNTLFNFPGEQANVPKGGLLTSVQIQVTPEPTSLALLAMAGAIMFRRRK